MGGEGGGCLLKLGIKHLPIYCDSVSVVDLNKLAISEIYYIKEFFDWYFYFGISGIARIAQSLKIYLEEQKNRNQALEFLDPKGSWRSSSCGGLAQFIYRLS